ncbi:MAG: undecaprenyl-diphosphate phosphatase [Pseudomonadales bacterium]|nr:undecaprenyl-diphosphate phosphatase [Pseudomonadales bacterium]
MDLLSLLVLAVLQGLTEFLPISSSAHLLLPSLLLGWSDQGLEFDIAVHLGTLLAVLFYFRSDLAAMLRGTVHYRRGAPLDPSLRLAAALAVATVPIVALGLPLKPLVEAHLRDLAVVAWATLGFGVLLGISDYAGRTHTRPRQVELWVASCIGMAQVLALVPGTSRSGITITMALFLGVSRTEAARFAMLLSIPAIAGAGYVAGVEAASAEPGFNWGMIVPATAISALTAFACISAFIRFVERIGMLPFVIYRIALGIALLWLM